MKSTSNRPSPKLRFSDFNDDWEQRQLGELVQFSKGSGYSKGDLKAAGTPIILYGRLYTKYETVISNVDTFADAKAGSVYSRGGEVIVPASGETAEDISIASVVEKSGVLLGGDLNIITPPEDLDSAFLAISISNGKPHNDMAKMAQGKSVVHLHNTDLEKIDLTYPSHEEQLLISGFFSGIDNLITLHQHKVEHLKNVKKSMLTRLFPKEGERVPEVRFKGFTGDWKQCKFSDVVEIGSGMDYKYLGDGDIPVYGTGGYMLSVDAALSEDKDAIGIGRKGTIDKPYILRAPFWTVDTLFYCIPKENHDLDFTNCLFQNVDWKKKDESTGVPSLSKVIINNVETTVPSYDEQKKIGVYFKSIDNLITLYQHKVEKLIDCKKAFLNKMFGGES